MPLISERSLYVVGCSCRNLTGFNLRCKDSRQFSPFGIQIDDGTLFPSRADEPGARLNPFAHTRSSSRRRMKAEILDENLEAMVGATPTRFRQSLVDSDAFIVSER